MVARLEKLSNVRPFTGISITENLHDKKRNVGVKYS